MKRTQARGALNPVESWALSVIPWFPWCVSWCDVPSRPGGGKTWSHGVVQGSTELPAHPPSARGDRPAETYLPAHPPSARGVLPQVSRFGRHQPLNRSPKQATSGVLAVSTVSDDVH